MAYGSGSGDYFEAFKSGVEGGQRARDLASRLARQKSDDAFRQQEIQNADSHNRNSFLQSTGYDPDVIREGNSVRSTIDSLPTGYTPQDVGISSEGMSAASKAKDFEDRIGRLYEAKSTHLENPKGTGSAREDHEYQLQRVNTAIQNLERIKPDEMNDQQKQQLNSLYDNRSDMLNIPRYQAPAPEPTWKDKLGDFFGKLAGGAKSAISGGGDKDRYSQTTTNKKGQRVGLNKATNKWELIQ